MALDGFTAWPEEVADSYRAAGIWGGETLGGLPDRWAENYRDRIAVVASGKSLSFQDLAEQSSKLAAGLSGLGIGSTDRVVVQLPGGIDFVRLCFALFRIGAIPVFALPQHRRHEIGHLVEHSEAVAYVVPSENSRFDYVRLGQQVLESSPALREVLVSGPAVSPAVSLDELSAGVVGHPDSVSDSSQVAMFLLSGGTTGLPKLIPRTHEDYVYNFREASKVCGFTSRTVYLVCLPIGHNFPLGCPGFLGALDKGGKVVIASDSSPEVAFSLIESERVTATSLVPTIALRWVESALLEDSDISSLELLQVGGARLNPEVARRVIAAVDATIQQVFGMAEGLLNYTRLDDPEEVLVETQGRPMSQLDEIRIVDESGGEVDRGQRGELLTRGPYTIRGYYRAPEHNARAFTADGFYRTGDIVRLHESGNLVVEGREKDLINRGGEKISAEEIETLVLEHESVFNVAAVAMPDRELGERTCAFVVPRQGADLNLEDLRRFLERRGVARYKWPERLELADGLPLTSVGKVDKVELRRRIAGELESESPDAAPSGS